MEGGGREEGVGMEGGWEGVAMATGMFRGPSLPACPRSLDEGMQSLPPSSLSTSPFPPSSSSSHSD